MYDVIIVGGGAAGLMAAKIISENNKTVLLLEAKSRLGGRIHCMDDFSFDVQSGAEFIHGNLETTFALLKEAGIKKQRLTGNFCRVKNGTWTMDSEPVAHWELLIKKLYECKKDITIDFFCKRIYYKKNIQMPSNSSGNMWKDTIQRIQKKRAFLLYERKWKMRMKTSTGLHPAITLCWIILL